MYFLGLDQYESDGSVSSDDDAGGGKRKELQRASGSEDSAETNGHVITSLNYIFLILTLFF